MTTRNIGCEMHKDILVPLNLFFANQHISWHVRKLGSSPALINCSEASDRRLSARDGRLFIGNYKHYHLTLSLPLLSCSSPSRQKSNYPNARRTQFNVITHQGCCGIGRNTTCCRSMEESTSLGTVYYEAGVAQIVAEHVPEDSNQHHMGTVGR